ncbi:MAG: hypothetical protein RLZZ209_1178 [Bacteroidota bacterium]
MQPLAERMRPTTLDEYIGQEKVVGPNAPLRKAIEAGHLPSCILWGPPGVGKTTLATLLAGALKRTMYSLSAVQSGVKEVRETLELAKKNRMFEAQSPILFIDEIHRFSKSQQDSLLNAVEKGIVTLVGATTENPSFEVISALLSRCQVYVLESLSNEHLNQMLQKAISSDVLFKDKKITLTETDALFHFSGGDGRKLLNLFELLITTEGGNELEVTNALVTERLQKNLAQYDKTGGESLEFIGRRLLILASEDIGLANPNALLLAQSCFDSIRVIGNPESRIILSQTVIYLATSPKSNSAYNAINKAMAYVEQTGDLPVPLHLRNAPTRMMKDLNYGADYKYPHDFPGNWVEQNYFPEVPSRPIFYKPSEQDKINRGTPSK